MRFHRLQVPDSMTASPSCMPRRIRMNATTQVLRRATALALALNVSLAFADVTIEERISVEGLMKFANMNGKELTMVAGDRARTESDLQMESKLMRMFAGSSMG